MSESSMDAVKQIFGLSSLSWQHPQPTSTLLPVDTPSIRFRFSWNCFVSGMPDASSALSASRFLVSSSSEPVSVPTPPEPC